jgi:hypothetical protein
MLSTLPRSNINSSSNNSSSNTNGLPRSATSA